MLSLDWGWARALLCSWLCSRARQCWVPRGLLGGTGHLLGSGVDPPFLWVMLYFLPLEYLEDCHIEPGQISVQDELLWLLQSLMEQMVFPHLGKGVWGPLKCRGAGQHILWGFCPTALLYTSRFSPMMNRFFPANFPNKQYQLLFTQGSGESKEGTLARCSCRGAWMFSAFPLLFFIFFFDLMTLSPLKQPSQRLTSCSLLSFHGQCEPHVSLQSWAGTLCCLCLAGRPQKPLPECCGDGAMAVVKCTAFI